MKKIAFDIDNTLIMPSGTRTGRDTPIYENIAIYKYFQSIGCYMILWSGSGIEWCEHWNEVLGLKCDKILPKEKNNDVDICFDDCDVNLAKVNIMVTKYPCDDTPPN